MLINRFLVCLILWVSLIGDQYNGLVHSMFTQRQLQTLSLNSTEIGTSSTQSRVCTSKSCKYFAKTFLSTLNRQVDPCHDFYKHVCQNARLTLSTVAHGRIIRNMSNLMRDLAQNQPSRGDRVPTGNFKRLAKLYQSCQRPSSSNLQTVVNLIRDMGGLPLAGDKSGWDDRVAFDWVQTTVMFRRAGLSVDQFFSFGIKNTYQTFKLGFNLKESKFFKLTHKDLEVYEGLVKALYPDTTVDMRDQLIELKDFGDQVADILDSQAQNKVEILELSEIGINIPGVDWVRIFRGLTGHYMFGYYEILVPEVEKSRAIAALLSQTKPRTLANHMMLNVIEEFAPFITNANGGQLSDLYPAPYCQEVIEKSLGIALAVEYYNRFVAQDSVVATRRMIDTIVHEMKLMIERAQWIGTDATKQAAKDKIDKLTFDVGIAEELLKPETSEWFYRSLGELSDDCIVGNLLAIGRCKYDRMFTDLLSQPTAKYSWVDYDSEPGLEVNARNTDHYNKVRIFLGFVERIFVDPTRLASINLGVLGATIAHEIMHSFDMTCIKADSFRPEVGAWWDYATERQYKRMADALIAQYDLMQPEGRNWAVDGRSTLCENIADNAGIIVAYRAFRRSLDSASPNEPTLLEGIDLDEKQLFWASFATADCVLNRDDVEHYKGGLHSPPEFRVNVPLSNYDEFSQDFNCPAGKLFMNPTDKLTVW